VNSPSPNKNLAHVLVADDSETIQKVVKIALARQPLKVDVAASWDEAKARILPGVGVILLDANLPGINGDIAKIKEALKQADSVPVVVMQGSHDRTLSDADLSAAGVQRTLQKPFDSAELIRLVTALTGAFDIAPAPAPAPALSLDPEIGLDLQLDGLPPLPPDLLDPSRKGKKAFEIAEETRPFGTSGAIPPPVASSFSPPPPPPPASSVKSASAPGPMPVNLPPLPVDAVTTQAIREAVMEYCQKHFKEVAVEVISAELRRLAEERARHLVDI
jgi:CheY-like chemotaxis protein